MIRDSNQTTKEDACADARRTCGNMLFLDLEQKDVYFMIFGRLDIPYKPYVGVLRDNDPIFVAFSEVDPHYYPFGLLAPLASFVFPFGSFVYRPDGKVYRRDAQMVLDELLNDITMDDIATRQYIKDIVSSMECALIYWPMCGALAFLRHSVIMDAFFGINVSERAFLSMNLRRCHKINRLCLMQNYIHEAMLIQCPSSPTYFKDVDVCAVHEISPTHYRAIPDLASNLACAPEFPQDARVVRNFEFLDNSYTTVDWLTV